MFWGFCCNVLGFVGCGFGTLRDWGCGCGAGVERLAFWEVLFFVFVVMVGFCRVWWGVDGFGVLRGWGCGCGAGAERLGFWEALFFVFVVMVWVLSGVVRGGWFLGFGKLWFLFLL